MHAPGYDGAYQLSQVSAVNRDPALLQGDTSGIDSLICIEQCRLSVPILSEAAGRLPPRRDIGARRSGRQMPPFRCRPVAVIHLLRHSSAPRPGDGVDGRTCMTKESFFDRTPEENYASFLNALAGIEDDAGIEGYSQDGIRLLQEAMEEFRSEYRSRHAS